MTDIAEASDATAAMSARATSRLAPSMRSRALARRAIRRCSRRPIPAPFARPSPGRPPIPASSVRQCPRASRGISEMFANSGGLGGPCRREKLPECVTPPDEVYELAKRRSMDFVRSPTTTRRSRAHRRRDAGGAPRRRSHAPDAPAGHVRDLDQLRDPAELKGDRVERDHQLCARRGCRPRQQLEHRDRAATVADRHQQR